MNNVEESWAAGVSMSLDFGSPNSVSANANANRNRFLSPRSLGETLMLKGNMLLIEEEFEKAKEAFILASRFYMRGFGPTSQRVAGAMSGIGKAMMGLKEFEEALGHFRVAEEIRRYGGTPLDLSLVLLDVGTAMMMLGDLEGIGVLTKCLRMHEGVLGECHPLNVDVHRALSFAYWKDGDGHSSKYHSECVTRIIFQDIIETMDVTVCNVAGAA